MTPQSVPSRRVDPGSSIRHVPWAKRLQHLDWLTRNERAFRCSAPAVWNSLPQTVLSSDSDQWCIAKNGGGYTHTGVTKGLKVRCLFMITEVSICCQKNPGGWYTPYTRVYTTDSDAVFKLRHSSLRLCLLSLLTNTLPGPSASEVTTLRRYTNLFIIIIISAGLVGMTNRQSRRQNRLQH